MGQMEERNLVLKDHVSEDAIDQVALSQKWQLLSRIDPKPESPKSPTVRFVSPMEYDNVYRKSWLTPDKSMAITYSVDRHIDVSYIAVKSMRIEEALQAARGLFDVYSDAELSVTAPAESVDAAIKKIRILSIAAQRNTNTGKIYLDIILRAFSSPDARLRKVAVTAANYLFWQELEEPLIRLYKTDPDAEVVSIAKQALQDCVAEHKWA